MSGALTGRCLCGAVRFSLAAPPLAARACWCRTCQYLSSGNASVGAIFRRTDLTLTGETAEFTSAADSGTPVRRRFCPRCGTPLFAEAPNAPDLLLVRAGALDDPELARPESTIWTGSAPAWGLIDPGLPRCEGQPS
ncbi:GFA family protein [Roseomonas sp. KE2513]|uniref:GFA family protein n=1 Tax=Roseomonas sp. KE2513 TaxID=2479202 RepID=UPI0018DF89A0|nr:GFA family protein [Roseomonas sp. KE2513]MBI0534766.1 GFA family protein [Roseomonas sp. KE2513]